MNEYITTGSFNLGNQITLKNVNSNIDRDYGPYEDKTLTEIAELLKNTIQIGKTIGVIEEGKIVEYWWQKDGDVFKFVLKQNSGVVDITDDAIRLLFVKRQPDNEIWYTSRDGNVVTPYDVGVFGVKITSNTYENGKGIITFDGPVTSIGYNAFFWCESLTSITIPNSVTSIGDKAFSYCRGLASIEIPNDVTSIGSETFSGCESLTSITIPESVTSIGDKAFSYCSSLTSVTIPNITSIENWTFESCSKLASVTIPDSVKRIGQEAFKGCKSLTSITIPDSVTYIGIKSFEGCESLTSITYEGTQGKWNTIDKRSDWKRWVPATYVQCTDGQVTL